jgi:transaldolase
MPENTLTALADHGNLGALLDHDGGNAEQELAEFSRAGIDLDATAEQLQREGAEAFVKSWEDLMSQIEQKTAQLKKAS